MKSKSTRTPTKHSKSSKSALAMGGYAPHEYQIEAMEKMLSQCALGLFAAPGLGKTFMTLGVFNILEEEGIVDTLLVVAKKQICYRVWPKELEKFKLPYKVQILHGKTKNEETLKQAFKNGVKVFIINYEGLPWLWDIMRKRRNNVRFDMLVVDESSKFKNSASMRFKTLRKMLHTFMRRYILTGNPRPNHLIDLFAQIYILDGGATLGQYKTQFISRFFVRTGFGGFRYKLEKPSHEQTIYKLIAPLVHRIDEDVLELPPLIKRNIVVQLPDDAMALYRELEEEMVAEFKGTSIKAFSAAVLTQKLRQVANGGIYIGDGKDRRTKDVHTEKAEAVAELVDELQGQPALIAFEFTHDRNRLLEVLGDGPVIDGTTTHRQMERYLKGWDAGQYLWLLGQYQSVSHGLNLQIGGKAVILHSLTWNYDDYDQFIRRVWRQGQKTKVFVYHILASQTVDYAILGALNSKERGQQAMFKVLKKYIEEIDRVYQR